MQRAYFVLTRMAWLITLSLPSALAIAQSGDSRESRRPEHVLSGIDISSRIDQVIAKYGSPDSVINVAVDHAPPGSGERNYVWHKGSTTISVTTSHYIDESGKEIESETYEVDVAGGSPQDEIGRTGAGLSLGDTRERANQVYGTHFNRSQIYKSAIRGDHVSVLAIEWKNGTRLCIAFDKRSRINFMTLMASVD